MAVGGAAAWYATGMFEAGFFALTMLAAICLDGANHMFNDHFDYKSGNDLRMKHSNPFAGGGRVLTRGLIDPTLHFRVALGFLIVGVAVGLYLVATRGLMVLILGLIGVVSLYFYVGPPFRWAYRGIGEALVGLNFGVLIVLGAYYVQTLRLDVQPALISIPIALLITAVLWINEFPDMEADISVGKRTLVGRLGPRRAVQAYSGMLLAAFGFLAAAVGLGLLPLLTLSAFITLPIALKAIQHARRNWADADALTPANAATVQLHLLFGVIIVISYLAAAFTGWTF
ncbi:MAG: prenyltransferase [Candidatus Bathyarchaeia archaeon]